MGCKLFCSFRAVFKLAQSVQDSTKQVPSMTSMVWGTCPEWSMCLSLKNPNTGGWQYGISTGIEERARGNLRGQLKSKLNFQGCSRKAHVEFPWVLIFDFGVLKGCHTILQNFQGWKIVFSGISKGKVTNLKIPGGFQKSISSNHPVLIFFGITYWPYGKIRYSIFLSLSSILGRFEHLYCDTGSLGSSTPCMMSKSLLFSPTFPIYLL